MTPQLKQVDLRRWPDRGTLTAVRDELARRGHKISKPAIKQQLRRGNKEMIRLMNREIERRSQLIRE